MRGSIWRMLGVGMGIVLYFGWAGAAGGAPRPVARLLEVRGSITASREDGSSRELAVFGTVYEGEQLGLEADSSLVLAFRASGRLERIEGPAEVTVGEGGCSPEEHVQQLALAREGGRPVQAAVQQLPAVTRGGATIVRTRPGQPDPPPGLPPSLLGPPRAWLEPARQTLVLAVRPVFDWQTLPDATCYELSVRDDSGELWSARVAEPPVEYGGPQPLGPGERYRWRVVATQTGGRASRQLGEAHFTVAGGEQRALAEELLALATDSEPGYLALAALWFQQERMLVQAIRAARRLAELEPEKAEYHRLLAELYDRAGRPEQAGEARERLRALAPEPPGDDPDTKRGDLLRRLFPPGRTPSPKP